MAEIMPERLDDSNAQAVVAQLEGIWRDEGRVRSYILADILIGLGVIDIIQISVDANCPKCGYPSIVAQTKRDLSMVRSVCPACDWRDPETS